MQPPEIFAFLKDRGIENPIVTRVMNDNVRHNTNNLEFNLNIEVLNLI